MGAPCDQLNRLERIETDIKEMKDSIDNKKDGLFKTMIQLTDHVKALATGQDKQGVNIDKLTNIVTKITESRIESNVKAVQVHEDMEELKNTVDALRISGVRTDAEDKLISRLTQERKIRIRWVVGLSITAGIAIVGLILKIIIG